MERISFKLNIYVLKIIFYKDKVIFNDKEYLSFQASGNASRFAIPFAKEFCTGIGFDIGCCKKEWAYPNSILIDKCISDEWDAMKLPDFMVDYIFSSHCLEHLPSWVNALDYWTERIKKGGILFLYLPHRSQDYWLPFNCRKHIHYFDQEIITKYLENSGKYKDIYASGIDLNHSFIVVAERI